MLERFFKNMGSKIETEAPLSPEAAIIEKAKENEIVDEETTEVSESEKVVPDGPDENKHRVLSAEDQIKRKNEAANPYDFKEVV